MATVTSPVVLDSTGQEMVEVLRGIKVAIASGKDSEVTTWKTIRANVRAGLGESLYPVGTKFVIYKYANGATKTGTLQKYYLDCVAHNKHFLKRHGEATADYSMTLQFHELLTDSMQFDAAEDLYGLSLDTSVVAWKTYYSDNAGTVVESPTGNPVTNGYYEKNDTSQYPRSTYGSNNWRHSAIRKWLNADKSIAAGSWWTRTTPCDKTPAYASSLPFQALLADDDQGTDSTLLDVVGPVTIRTVLSNIKRGDASDYYLDADANGNYSSTRLAYDETEDTFFLPTTKEIHCNVHNETDGVLLDYYDKYSDHASPIANGVVDNNYFKHKPGTSSSADWWLRSAYVSHSNDVWIVDSSGNVDGHSAYNAIGVAPLCTIY